MGEEKAGFCLWPSVVGDWLVVSQWNGG